jgi:hypothetical protein
MCAAGFVEKLADARQGLDDGLILRDFAIEDAQGIGDGAALAIGRTSFQRPAPKPCAARH